jgi:hypothetical protein
MQNWGFVETKRLQLVALFFVPFGFIAPSPEINSVHPKNPVNHVQDMSRPRLFTCSLNTAFIFASCQQPAARSFFLLPVAFF